MYCVVLVTTKDGEEARRIAEALLNDKLIACANILPAVTSLFWWEGKVDRSDEVLMVLKTKRALFAKLAKTVKALHSYEVPEIIALPIVSGYNPYLNWINSSTSSGKGRKK
jgi:periplasmic divalent cation tolerance protein